MTKWWKSGVTVLRMHTKSSIFLFFFFLHMYINIYYDFYLGSGEEKNTGRDPGRV